MRLRRMRPADWAAAAGQAAAVLMLAGWSGWTTYYAAQSWAATPDGTEGWLGAGAGALGAAVAALGGLMCARVAGARDGRLVGRLAALDVLAEVAEPLTPTRGVPAAPVRGELGQPARGVLVAPARGVLAAPVRRALPAAVEDRAGVPG